MGTEIVLPLPQTDHKGQSPRRLPILIAHQPKAEPFTAFKKLTVNGA